MCLRAIYCPSQSRTEWGGAQGQGGGPELTQQAVLLSLRGAEQLWRPGAQEGTLQKGGTAR